MDVKPENLFIDEAKRIKLGDFGMALRINYPTDTEGDARYVAPELLYSAFRTVGASPVFDIYRYVLGPSRVLTSSLTDLDCIWCM